MAISYTWNFPILNVIYSEDGYSNVVQSVNWIYIAADGEFSSTRYGSVTLSPPSGQFVQYSDLTPEIVQGWVVSALGQDTIDEMTVALAESVNSKMNPTGGSLPPPWS